MTDPTADAAKLLPCPFCGGETGITLKHPLHPLYELSCHNHKCSFRPQITFAANEKEAAIAKWNTRPQPAPPEGDPDAIIAELKLAIANAVEGDDPGSVVSVPLVVAQRILDRLGLAARPKVQDAKVAEILEGLDSGDPDQTPTPKECRHLLERLAGEKAGFKRAAQDALTALETQTNRTKAAESKLAEREAELAKAQLHLAQSDYAHYVRTLPDTAVVTETNWLDYEKDAVMRHRNRVRKNRGEPEIATDAARQQQKASDEPRGERE